MQLKTRLVCLPWAINFYPSCVSAWRATCPHSWALWDVSIRQDWHLLNQSPVGAPSLDSAGGAGKGPRLSLPGRRPARERRCGTCGGSGGVPRRHTLPCPPAPPGGFWQVVSDFVRVPWSAQAARGGTESWRHGSLRFVTTQRSSVSCRLVTELLRLRNHREHFPLNVQFLNINTTWM